MLYSCTDNSDYKKIFIKKFENFSHKIATLISVTTSDKGVIITHENSGKVYEYEWDYNLPVKSFIKDIHDDLLEHLPVIARVKTSERPLTEDEKRNYLEVQANALELGQEPVDVPETIKETVQLGLYRIEKVIVMKDIFIIRDLDTDELQRYHMEKSCVHFLSNYRKGRFDSIADAGAKFFETSKFLGIIAQKER